MLDAYGQLEFSESFNIWAGRLLPPSDRANLAGSYYANAWQFPGVVSQYPQIFAGRDTGVTVIGLLLRFPILAIIELWPFQNQGRMAPVIAMFCLDKKIEPALRVNF